MNKTFLKIWRLYAFASGLLVATLAISWVILWASEVKGPVIISNGDFRLESPVVREGGLMRYSYDVERRASCPGFVVTTMVSQTNHGPPAIVTFRRPVLAFEIRSYDDYRASVPLPESVVPGTWSVVTGVDSQCPTYQRYDKLVEFTVRVIPK
jgi:hypothetical protein